MVLLVIVATVEHSPLLDLHFLQWPNLTGRDGNKIRYRKSKDKRYVGVLALLFPQIERTTSIKKT